MKKKQWKPYQAFPISQIECVAHPTEGLRLALVLCLTLGTKKLYESRIEPVLPLNANISDVRRRVHFTRHALLQGALARVPLPRRRRLMVSRMRDTNEVDHTKRRHLLKNARFNWKDTKGNRCSQHEVTMSQCLLHKSLFKRKKICGIVNF